MYDLSMFHHLLYSSENEIKVSVLHVFNMLHFVCTQQWLWRWWWLFHGTERNGTERNYGLKYGTELVLRNAVF